MKTIVPVYPWPMRPQLVEALSKIESINPVEALPGGPGPVLAIGKRPPFACDAIVVLTPQTVAYGVAIVASQGIELSSMGDFLGAKEVSAVSFK